MKVFIFIGRELTRAQALSLASKRPLFQKFLLKPLLVAWLPAEKFRVAVILPGVPKLTTPAPSAPASP